MSTPQQSIARVRAAANPLVKGFLQRSEVALSAAIQSFIKSEGAPDDGFASGNRIGDKSGQLSRSLLANQEGHIGRYTVPSSSALETKLGGMVFGIDTEIIRHALTQEYGDSRTVTDKMRGFFWARYKETGFEKWKYMALSKKAAFEIPARPYYAPGVVKFEKTTLPKLQQQLRDKLVAAFNGGA